MRVGVTGLAAVFLLTLLAAAIFAFLGQDTHAPDRAGGPAVANQAIAAEESPKEPLAELGVAPGNAPKTPPAGPVAAAPQPQQPQPRSQPQPAPSPPVPAQPTAPAR